MLVAVAVSALLVAAVAVAVVAMPLAPDLFLALAVAMPAVAIAIAVAIDMATSPCDEQPERRGPSSCPWATCLRPSIASSLVAMLTATSCQAVTVLRQGNDANKPEAQG